MHDGFPSKPVPSAAFSGLPRRARRVAMGLGGSDGKDCWGSSAESEECEISHAHTAYLLKEARKLPTKERGDQSAVCLDRPDFIKLHHRAGIQILTRRGDALNSQPGRLVTHLCQGHSGNPVSGCKGEKSRLAVSFSVKSVQSNSFWLKNTSWEYIAVYHVTYYTVFNCFELSKFT